ncbi:tubby C-terminal domain-like protein [Bacillus cihuensis]|uniref:tubby C-terminal domain-like protein n=1 Tax=Bacillus cihuensis TaxID=1208599 RepID=UPI00040B23FB|nr:hypothetical protein [Bacillus cihuensis]
MERFTYQVPRGNVHISTIMPIINEHSKTVFEMRKQQHRFLARIVNGSLRYGIPYCYKIANEYTKPLYTIDCVFPGIRYKLIEHSSSQIVQIVPHRVQLIEKAYSFRLDSHEYYFEKDYTSSGYLKYDNQQVATVSMPIKYDISLESDTIIIKATTQEFAALAAVLYHTFYYYGA